MPAQSLIGPAWYPTFLYVAGTTLVVLLMSRSIWLLSRFASQGASAGTAAIGEALGGAASDLFMGTGIIVLAFAVLERVTQPRAENTTDWDPRVLPAIRPDAPRDHIAAPAVRRGIWWTVALLVLLNVFPNGFGVFTGYQYRYTVVPLPDFGIPVPALMLNTFWLGALTLNMAAGIGPTQIDTRWIAADGWSADHVDAVASMLTTLRRVTIGALWVALAWQVWQSARRIWHLTAGRPAH